MNNETQLEIFRHNVRFLRTSRNLSKTYIARSLGISISSLNKFESPGEFPNIPIAVILRVSALFGVPVPVLLSQKLYFSA